MLRGLRAPGETVPRIHLRPAALVIGATFFFAAALEWLGLVIALPLAMLIAAAATSGVPYAFKLIIDRGFSGSGDIGRWFQYLLILVVVLALATAVRFYFVSWIGERVVADIRLAVHRNLLRLAPGFFEENRPAEIASREELPSAASTSRARSGRGGASSPRRCASTPLTRPVVSSVSAPVTVTCSSSRAPAFSACLARISSKSVRGRTSP